MGYLPESSNQEQDMKCKSHRQLASTMDILPKSTNQGRDIQRNSYQHLTLTTDTLPLSINQEAFSSSPLSSVPSPASSSSLSSLGSSPGTPEYFFSSPPCSQEITIEIPRRPTVESIDDNDSNPRPAKKRRTTGPKERTTQHLDLRMRTRADLSSHQAQMDVLMRVIRKRRKIVVIAGAGISVSAGIPDFRSSTGLFTTLRSQHNLKASGKHLFDASVYKDDSSTSSFHDMVRSLSDLAKSSQPTLFHHLLATLADEGRLLRLYTQNVDGIDTSLPPLATTVPLNTKGPWPTTIQLHGGLDKMVCQKCHHLSQFEASLFDGPTPPSCRECKERDGLRTMFEGKRSHGIGRLRPRIVLYNEYNPDEEAIGAVTRADLRSRPDAVIVVGTSLKIPGVRRIVREMCGVVRGRRDGVAIWINKDPAPLGKDFENCWDLVVQGSSDEVARRARMRRWDATESEGSVGQESLDFSSAPTELEDAESTPDSPSKNPTFDRVQGILTPARSPHSKSTKLDGSELTARLSKEALKSPSKHSKPKTKQSTLSGLAKPTTSDSKKKLSTKSKSRKKPTATNPSKTINSSFSVTKKAEGSSATKAPGTKHSSSQINRTVDESSSLQAETKSEASDSHQMESHSKMNLTINVAQDPARPCGTMLPISPSEARNNNGSPIIHHSPDWLVKSEEFTVSQEAMSPTTAQRGEIFSPKGPLPKNSGIILN